MAIAFTVISLPRSSPLRFRVCVVVVPISVEPRYHSKAQELLTFVAPAMTVAVSDRYTGSDEEGS